jgi:hypothetical protein
MIPSGAYVIKRSLSMLEHDIDEEGIDWILFDPMEH